MKQALSMLLAILLIGAVTDNTAGAVSAETMKHVQGELGATKPDDKIVILWTSGDREVALKMVFMYALNAKKNNWWGDVTFIVWGPSSKLLSTDKELQAEIKKMKEAGAILEACKACTDEYGVSAKLQELGIDVKYMGQPLTRYIKEGRHVLTF